MTNHTDQALHTYVFLRAIDSDGFVLAEIKTESVIQPGATAQLSDRNFMPDSDYKSIDHWEPIIRCAIVSQVG